MPDEAELPPHKQLPQWVAERIRSAILDGRIKPGEWLRQERLAQENGVSQMPVREALKRLASEGLVEHVPYRGVRVVEFSAADVEDLYACRSFIEGMAARFAATNISDAEVADLKALATRMAKCKMPVELPEYRELNRQFHGLIFAACGRSYLVRTLAQLWSAFPTMLWSNIPHVATASVPERDEPDVEEHAAIITALAAHDARGAERAVHHHIDSAGNALLTALKAQQ
ncbi:MAG TPA: GntR family transcriptional regulator [Thermoanaerobaculaceae bacterium]|nr:GntR family transcriptional regulator [Thermoanaerobaculaceae bacterium]